MQRSVARIHVAGRGAGAVALCLMLGLGQGAGAQQSLTWALPGAGAWNEVDSNWLGGTGLTFTNGDAVTFAGLGAPAIAIDIDSADVVTSAITFSANGYVIGSSGVPIPFAIRPSNGVLALALDPNVSAEIAAPLVSDLLADAISVDGGTGSLLTLSGDNTGSLAALTLNGGGVDLTGDYGGAVVGAGADVTVAADVAGALTVQDGSVAVVAGGSVQGAVAVTGTGALVADGGTFVQEQIDLTGGSAQIAADTVADVVNDGGVVTVDAGQTLTGTVQNTAGTLTNTGTISDLVTNAGDVVAAGTFAGGISNTGGTVDVTGDTVADVTNSGGDLTIAAGQTLTGAVVNADAGSVTVNAGTLDGDLTVTDGLVQNDAIVQGVTEINGGRVENSGTLGGAVTVDQVDPLIAAELADTGGQITGLLTNESGDVTADGTTFQSGIVQNGGTLTITDVDLGAAGLANAGGSVTVDGAIDATSVGDITNTGGDLTIAVGQTVQGAVENADAGSVTVNAGTLDGALTVSSGLVQNSGTVTGTTDVTAGAVENSGTLVGDVTLDRSGGALVTFDDTGGVIAGVLTNEDATVTADGTTFQSGIDQNGGTLTVTGVDLGTGLRNAGGTVLVDGPVAATTVGPIDNTGGDLTIAAGQTVQGDLSNQDGASLTQNAGTIDGNVAISVGRVESSGTVTGTLSVTQGIAVNTGTIEGDVTIDRLNTPAATFEDTGGTLDGVLTTNGTVRLDGTTVTGGLVQNDGTTTVTGVDLGAGATNTGGRILIDGATAATTVGDIDNVGGDLSISAGQTLVGDVTNRDAASRILNAGTIEGDLTSTAGSADNSGTIDGDVDFSGGNLTADNGTITGTTQIADGLIRADNSSFEGGVILELDGRVLVRGDSNGDMDNLGGQITVEAGNTLTGDVTQSDGRLRNFGTVAGDVTVSGGQVIHDVGADISGLTTLQGDVDFDATGGTFSGGLRLEGGTLTADNPIVGDVENAGTDLTIADGETVDGSLTNSSGTLDLAGTVLGDFVVDGGTAVTQGTASVRDETTVTGGSLRAEGGTFGGGITVDGGALVVAEDITTDGLRIDDGTLDVDAAATVDSDLVVMGGVSTVQGALVGDLRQSGGTVTQSGSIDGAVDLSGGTLSHESGTIAGTTDVTGGTLVIDGGDFAGLITNDGGVVDITGASVGDLTNTSGEVVAGGALTGDLRNADTVTAAGGSFGGALTNTGVVDVTAGDLAVGSFTSSGEITVTDGNTLAFGNGVVTDGGTLTIADGVLAGDLTADTGAVLDFGDAEITGDFISLTDFTPGGDVTVGGDLTLGAGVVTFENTAVAADGAVRVAEGVTLELRDGARLAGATVQLDGPVLATGEVSFGGDVTNTGAFTASGELTFGGGLRNSGTVNLINGSTDDLITIGGDGLSDGGLLQFDLDLADSEGAADAVLMQDGAFITGEVQLQFNVLGSGGQQADDVLLIDVAANDPGDFTISADEIVDPSGILTYSVTRDSAGDVVIEDGLNPGIAGLAGNIVLTQSLIGSVVNRPSSPFVTTLAYDDPDPCGPGLWTRALAGGATSSGEVAQEGDDGRPFDGDISATFAGIQMGGDYACFNGAFNGWDLAVGGIGGVNVGQTTQPVFAIDVNSADNLSALQTGTTDVDFTQFYGGVYGTAVRGPLAFDLQYRLESTRFSATNEGAGDLPGLGLDDTGFDSFGRTLSGAASYFYAIPDSNIALVPTAGFAYTQVSTDKITFQDRGTVQIDDFESKIGFVGGTMAISSFGEDGVTAYRQFISATMYNDFAEGPTSTFSPVDNSGDRSLRSENLGLYGEISVGFDFVRVLQENEFGAVKQISANARADVRLSDRLQSWGVTAQARFQF